MRWGFVIVCVAMCVVVMRYETTEAWMSEDADGGVCIW